MSELSLSRAWEETRDIFAHDGGLLSAVTLALLVFPEVIVGLITPAGVAMAPLGRIVWIVAGLIGILGQLALVRLALGPSTSVGEAIAHGARRFPATLGAFLLLCLALGVIVIPLMVVLALSGAVALPVEGRTPPPSFMVLAFAIMIGTLLIGVKFMLTIPISAAEESGPLHILKRSWRVTAGHYWRLLAFLLLMIVTTIVLLIAAQSVGLIAGQAIGGRVVPLSLGALVLALFQAVASATMTALLTVMTARFYVQLAGRGDAQASVPSSGI